MNDCYLIDNSCGGWIVADCDLSLGHFCFMFKLSSTLSPSNLVYNFCNSRTEGTQLNGSCIQHEQITSNDQLVGSVDSTNSQDWGLEYWNGVWV